MEEELKGWDKIRAATQKKAALSSYMSGRKKISPELMEGLRKITAKGLPRPDTDWMAKRPVVKDPL